LLKVDTLIREGFKLCETNHTIFTQGIPQVKYLNMESNPMIKKLFVPSMLALAIAALPFTANADGIADIRSKCVVGSSVKDCAAAWTAFYTEANCKAKEMACIATIKAENLKPLMSTYCTKHFASQIAAIKKDYHSGEYTYLGGDKCLRRESGSHDLEKLKAFAAKASALIPKCEADIKAYKAQATELAKIPKIAGNCPLPVFE